VAAALLTKLHKAMDKKEDLESEDCEQEEVELDDEELAADMLAERLRVADIKKRHDWIGSVGVLYAGYDLSNGNAVASAGFVYMARRAIICTLIFVVISANSLVPLIIILLLQIFYTMYLCQLKPYEALGDNKMEVVNESLALYMLYFFQCLNDPAVSIVSRTYISWGMLSMAFVLVTFNAALIGAAVV